MAIIENLKAVTHLKTGGGRRKASGVTLSIYRGNGESIGRNWKRNKWSNVTMLQFLLGRYSVHAFQAI